MKQRLLNLFLFLILAHPCLLAQSVSPRPQSFFDYDEETVNGTTGTPLGGFGCGGIKFNANDGFFAAMTTPPADAYDFKQLAGARIEMSVDGKVTPNLRAVKSSSGLPCDDALWPLHRVDFGRVDGIATTMTAFSPIDNVDYLNMSLPYAFFDVTLTNTTGKDAVVALDFLFPDNKDEWAVVSDQSSPVKLKAGKSRSVRVVVAWYDRTDSELAYYKNLYSMPEPIARRGLEVFSRLEQNAKRIANGMRASSLPHWLQNQVLNTLSSVVVNSMYKKDGRVAFAEGQWTCFGTMDQMWLARQIICQTLPFFAWRELEYWARTQMKNGQIHHDFNLMDVGNEREKRSRLVAWDDTEHSDYRNIQKWVDLNCGFIISVYEAYRTTGNRSEMRKLWPNVKRAAAKIQAQVEQLGSKTYPYTFTGSENSYDAGGNPDPYNANLSVVAYKIMSELSAEMGEPDQAAVYAGKYDTAVKSFAQRYIYHHDPMIGKHCENVFGGQEMAYHLRLGQMWSKAETDSVICALNNYYYPYYWGLGYPEGTYDEWTPYLLVHYGGLLLNTCRIDEWYVLQKDAYMRQYQNRDRVFDHPLNILPHVKNPNLVSSNVKSKKQYISIPSVWRNYYDLIGFSRDARTHELWLTPILFEGNKRTDSYFMTPETDGTIDVEETIGTRTIVVRATKGLAVKGIHLRDDFEGCVNVSVNGKSCRVTRCGEGYAKELLVDWNGKINSKGLVVAVKGSRKPACKYEPAKPDRDVAKAFVPNAMSPFDGLYAVKADKQAGTLLKDGFVTSCNNFDYILFSNVDFAKKGTSKVELRLNSLYADSELEIALDDNSGAAVGSYKLPKTNGFQVLELPVDNVKGTHNVVLRFYGSHSDNLMDIDYVKFK